MIAKTTTATHRAQTLAQTRAHSDALFALVRPDAFSHRPVPERHRIIFYFGHLEAFDWNLIGQGALTLPSFHAEFDRLFAFGIDPKPGQWPTDQPSDWPALEDVQRYNARVRRALDPVLDEVPEPMFCAAIEHRLMHSETFVYLLHNLSLADRLIPPPSRPSHPGPAPIHDMIEIPGSSATLGQKRGNGFGHGTFGWDNEFDEHTVPVSSFAMSKYKVTNGQYLEFVRAGAAPPHFWVRHGTQWFWRTMAGEIPLPLHWPVYVTHGEAQAYATWAGKSLPTEAQFHRAAYGTAQGEERAYPWGDAPPDPRYGNFDCRQWDPLPVTATPLGDNGFGVCQLVGNGWEWTSTVFQPFPDFQPFSFYPGYSAPFFDGAHYVLKGGSSRTDARLLRRSFRNWFLPGYSYAYAGFRCVEN